jgi:PAS domain S-box-containing protein
MASSGPSDEFGVSTGTLDAIVRDTDFFRSLVENGSDAIVSIDRDSTIIYANQSVERVFGYEPEAMIGEDLTMIMPDRFHTSHFDAVDRYLDTGERTLEWNDIELPAEHKAGHEVPLSITFEEHTYDGERIFSGIMRDVSDRKAREENLRTLQAVARDLMQLREPDAIAERVVDAAEETLAFPIVSVFLHDEVAGRLRPAAHSAAVHDTFDEIPDLGEGSLAWAAFRSGEQKEYPVDGDDDPVYRHDGPVESEYVFPMDGHGCLLVSSTDDRAIDEEELSLARILAANAEVALGRAEREAERERQRERLERFASMVSHDLRDPLQTAKATVAVARAGDEEALYELDDLFDRMDELIGDVLTLAKQGRTVGETESVALGEVAEAAWSTVETGGAALDIDAPPTVSADPERLRTLFENLIRNSVEHGSTGNRTVSDDSVEHGSAGPRSDSHGDSVEHGSTGNRTESDDSVEGGSTDVTIRVGALDDGAGFYVEDDGPGFGDAETDRLFEYGYTTEPDNTGFGLNIVGDIVDAHGWTITATTGRDGGARFEVETR